MNRDWVVTGCAFLLFLSGFLWAQFLPDSEFWKSQFKMDTGDYIGAASAIAAAIAAFAAWRSASVSSAAATDSRSFSRMQAYILHKQLFETLLIDIERELDITFRERNGLYNDIFPDNRHLERPFNMQAHGAAFTDWIEKFKELIDQTYFNPPMQPPQMKIWMVEQVVLADDCLRFKFTVDDETFRISTIDTKISLEEPMYALSLSNTVLNHFCVFGLVNDYLVMSDSPPWFDQHLRDFKFYNFLHDNSCDYR
ncbi:hypothetical protein BJN42_11665 [Pseudomonas koreensis]|nr:hypothetical protein BJN42_11665 [Pseudomonas koreensis]